jgi:hypothetical protein
VLPDDVRQVHRFGPQLRDPIFIDPDGDKVHHPEPGQQRLRRCADGWHRQQGAGDRHSASRRGHPEERPLSAPAIRGGLGAAQPGAEALRELGRRLASQRREKFVIHVSPPAS